MILIRTSQSFSKLILRNLIYNVITKTLAKVLREVTPGKTKVH